MYAWRRSRGTIESKPSSRRSTGSLHGSRIGGAEVEHDVVDLERLDGREDALRGLLGPRRSESRALAADETDTRHRRVDDELRQAQGARAQEFAEAARRTCGPQQEMQRATARVGVDGDDLLARLGQVDGDVRGEEGAPRAAAARGERKDMRAGRGVGGPRVGEGRVERLAQLTGIGRLGRVARLRCVCRRRLRGLPRGAVLAVRGVLEFGGVIGGLRVDLDVDCVVFSVSGRRGHRALVLHRPPRRGPNFSLPLPVRGQCSENSAESEEIMATSTTDPKPVATRCLAAWSSGDFDAARALLDAHVQFTGPLGHTEGVDDYIEGVRGLSRTVKRVDQRRVFGEGDDVCIVYESRHEVDGMPSDRRLVPRPARTDRLDQRVLRRPRSHEYAAEAGEEPAGSST